MKKIYKRLFVTNYNNKAFCIFLDENYHRAFLRVNSNGTYAYPLLEDYLYLNDYYNNRNPFLLDITKCTFKEKAKKIIVGGAIYLSLVIPIGMTLSYIDPFETSASSEKDNSQIEIKDNNQLDEILGYKTVSLDVIHRAIDNNDKIFDDYKNLVHFFINALAITHPEIDLRIFYENIKTNEFVFVEDDYFEKLGKPGINARYDCINNRILIKRDCEPYTLYHELEHTVNNYYRVIDGTVVYKTVSLGYTMDEAMTNKMISFITKDNSYYLSGLVLDYFVNYVDYSFNDHVQKGVYYLIDLLKNRYPSVDIDFIIESLDTASDDLKRTQECVYVDEIDGLLDELFKICELELENTEENYYEPFVKFANILLFSSDIENKDTKILQEYFNKYNEILKDKGLPIINWEDILNKLNNFPNIDDFIYKENEVKPCLGSPLYENYKSYYQVYDNLGNIINVETTKYHRTFTSDNNIFYQLELNAPMYYDTIGSNDYWMKMALDIGFLTSADLEKIPITYNKEFLGNELISDLNIAIGKSSKGNVSYIIKNSENKIIFKSDDEISLNNCGNFISLPQYLLLFNPKEFNSLELTMFLNDYYLKIFSQRYSLFHNLLVVDEELKVTPNYHVIVTNTQNDYVDDLGEFYFYSIDDDILLSPIDQMTYQDGKIIYLKDILYYYGMLDEDILEYNFSYDELIDLYYKYVSDVSLENNYLSK